MKKRIFIAITLIVVLFYSVGIFIFSNYDFSKTKSKTNDEIIKQIKSDFKEELDLIEPFSEHIVSHIVLGQYGDGYILVHFYLSVGQNYFEITPKTTEIDGVAITHFPFANFYYFEERKVVKDLNNIYEEQYIDKDDLKERKLRFEEWKDYNYWIQTDYIVDYVLDYSDIKEKTYTKNEIKDSFTQAYNLEYAKDLTVNDFYLLGKYSFGYIFVNNPNQSGTIETLDINKSDRNSVRIEYNSEQEFYFYYPYSEEIIVGLNDYWVNKVITYEEYVDIKNKLALFEENNYLLEYDFDIE